MAPKKTAAAGAIVKANTAAALARPMEDWEQEMAVQAKDEVAHEATGLPRVTKKANQIMIDGNPVKDNKLRCVIVDYIFTHTYFKTKYVEGKSGSPDCYAYGTQDNGLSPFPGSRDPQGTECDKCAFFAFGSNPESPTGKGKMCPGGRKLAIVVPNDDPDSLASAELRVLTANGGSLQNWGKYIRSLPDVTPSGNCRAVLTEISTEVKGTVFVYTFKAVDRLDSAMGPKIKALGERAHQALMQPWPDVADDAAPAAKPAAKRRGVKGQ